MLLVDIEVPTFSKKYHFTLEENVNVEMLLTEIVTVIEQKEQSKLTGKRENLLLCHTESRKILIKNRSLNEQEIKNGETLILI